MPRRTMISGAIAAAAPGYGGHTWAVLQYLIGFERLGFETYYVEQMRGEQFRDAEERPSPLRGSVNASHFEDVMDRFGLSGRSALLQSDGPDSAGLSHAEVERLAPDIDLFVNRSGHFQISSIVGRARRRIYLDVDPGYTQVWQERYGVDMNLRGHDHYVTVGLNLGRPDCPFPTCGIRWEKTLPPVVLDEWSHADSPGLCYSTVGDWRGFGTIEWRGKAYGQKADGFMEVLALPRRVSVPLELCLLLSPEERDRERLLENGWRLASPRENAATPDAYREYVFRSRGEFSVVKQAYAANTGWFSDRSACYLAAGRPVLVQDTGFGDVVPTGEGALTFTDLESAAEGLEEIERDYPRHSSAAVELAREFLDSDRVLARLCAIAEL